jgi:hypothetical protein
MSVASGTATRAELVTLSVAVQKLEIVLRQVTDGYGSPTRPGRFTPAEIDTAITAVSTAITAVNA